MAETATAENDSNPSWALVERAMRLPLPGWAAQEVMAPDPRARGRARSDPPRQSAVLLVLFERDDQIRLVLIRRTMRGRHHGGQIGLPGGGSEPGDCTLWDTALREAHEELGIVPDAVVRLANLSELAIAPSHYTVHPFVGRLRPDPCWVPDPGEVADVLELRLADLLDPALRRYEAWDLRGISTRVPQYLANGHVVWGATAMILSEFAALLEAACEGAP